MEKKRPKWRHLTYNERLQIEKLLKQKKRIVEIANILGIDRSTIYRELQRNGMKQENYNATIAQRGEYKNE